MAVVNIDLRAELLAGLPPCGCPTCDDLRCEVASGRCHGPGCAEPVQRARQTSRKERRVHGYPMKYCSRECGGAVKKGSHGARVHELLAQAGACGCPACDDVACDVSPGLCHRAGCENPATLAASTSVRDRVVNGRQRMYCSRECAAAGDDARKASVAAAAHARHTELREELLAQAGACGCPACDNHACEVAHGRCHYPGCEENAAIASQTQSRTNGPRSRGRRRQVRGAPTLCCPRHSMWKVDAMCEVRGRGLLLGIDVAGMLLDRTVSRYVRDGRMPVAERIHGLTAFNPEDAKLLMRKLARARTAWENPDFVGRFYDRRWFVPVAEKHGVQFALGRRAEMIARAEERRRLRSPRRRGRKPAQGPPQHHEEWLQAFLDLRDYYERQHCAGEPMPSDWRLYLEVAREDFTSHPDRWPYDPADESSSAADRVAKAIKALQIRQSGIQQV